MKGGACRTATTSAHAAVGAASARADVPGAGEAAGAVCALIESRAREVGICALHRRSMEFELTQFSDRGNYSRTIAAVLALEPTAVVVSRTARGTHLLQVLDEALGAAGLPEPFFAERRHFNEIEGQKLLEEVDVVGLQASEFAAKFVACAAFSAMWRFAESSMELRWRPAAVRVTFRGASDIMVIDTNTAKLLELVVDARHHREQGSLFSLFTCRTPGGARLLRQSLLQPLACKSEIEARQTAVEVLLSNETLFYELQQLLPAVGDVDLLAARLTTEPKTRGPQWCKAAVRTALRLRGALSTLPLLADALKASSAGKSALLNEAHEVLTHVRFPLLLEELNRVLDTEGPHISGGQGSVAHVALMYAIRPSVSPLLDIARQTWNDALEQIHALHRSYAVKYMELNIKLEYTERRGWYLSHTSQGAPQEFLHTAAKGSSGRYISTTRELTSENFKLRQGEREILSQTVLVLAGLYDVLRTEAPLLYKISHTASMLDLIQSFVGFTLLLGEYVRPVLTDDPLAPIDIKAGRHPLMERSFSQDANTCAFGPLDYFIDKACHFQTVTGANGGGKSTYLQTIAQLVVLAQIGCLLPARHASIRIVSSLFTRIGTSDNIEASASTFLVEMQEAAHILRDVAPESLVLIDELGRGTAHADGISICWAICERLIELQVYTLFATHFFEVCRLAAIFPGFRNMHLRSLADSEDAAAQVAQGGKAEIGRRRQQDFVVHHVTCLETLLSKPQARYGIHTAEQVGLPADLLATARAMAAMVDKRLDLQLPYDSTAGGVRHGQALGISLVGDERSAAEVQTADRLLALAAGSTLAPEVLAGIVRQLQRPWLERRRGGTAAAVHGDACSSCHRDAALH